MLGYLYYIFGETVIFLSKILVVQTLLDPKFVVKERKKITDI